MRRSAVPEENGPAQSPVSPNNATSSEDFCLTLKVDYRSRLLTNFQNRSGPESFIGVRATLRHPVSEFIPLEY